MYMGIFLYYAYTRMNIYLYLSAQLSIYLSQFIDLAYVINIMEAGKSKHPQSKPTA